MNINENNLDQFLGNEEEENVKKVKSDNSIIERVDKKIIVEGGKQLLNG
jgi:hypothetical protein